MDNPNSFANYVNSVINLDTLEKLADDMDKDIQESQSLMDEIKTVFTSIPTQSKSSSDSGFQHEDPLNFLETDAPNLLLPNMCDSVLEIDLDDVIVTMKTYAEDLKKCYVDQEPMKNHGDKNTNDLDLDQYAFSLDQLGKRLANIKLTKKEEVNNRNPELEAKLTQLCDDVNKFTQVVQAKAKLTEVNKNWNDTQQDGKALQYNIMITSLLSGVNEVIYLLRNSNKG